MGQQCHVSRQGDQGISRFSSSLFHKAFPRGFSTGLSHVPTWCESILGLKFEAVQGIQVSLEWTETSWRTSGVSPGEAVLVSIGGMHVRFPPEL